MRALMFAAGAGERLRPQTEKLAKPAIPFLNVPMLGFPLFYLEQAGLKNLIINTHHLPATVENAISLTVKPKLSVYFSHEKDLILGSGGGLGQAVDLYGGDEDLVIANADAVALYHDAEIVKRLVDRHQGSKARATLLLCPFPKAKESFGGVYVDGQSRVRKFSKTAIAQAGWTPYHFTGFMIVSPQVWAGLSKSPSNLFYDVLQKQIDAGAEAQALVVNEVEWFETGNQKDFLNATRSCLDILAAPSPAQRTLIRIMDRFTPGWWKGWRVAEELKVLGSLPWPDRLKITDFAVFGPQTQFAPNVHLERCVVAGSAEIPADRHCKDSLIVA